MRTWKKSYFDIWKGQPIEWTCMNVQDCADHYAEVWKWKYIFGDTKKRKREDV